MNNKKYSILYIDDEEVNLQLFYYTFRRDFDIHMANSAKKGLLFLEKNYVDVIITDQRMPEMTGVEFLKEIHNQFPCIPPNRLMISGYARNEDIDKAFDNYLLFSLISKPWNADNVKNIILTAINESNNQS